MVKIVAEGPFLLPSPLQDAPWGDPAGARRDRQL
jgi:hypothetical protein